MQDILKWTHAITLFQRLAASPRFQRELRLVGPDGITEWYVNSVIKLSDICGIAMEETKGFLHATYHLAAEDLQGI